MSFAKNIKEKVLIETARHCCVCHRYKGVKVEVHHIKHKSLGGEDTYKNAISLCFDCHADAGHYNPKHPRGTKFSPTELKKAKDSWITQVKEHNISEPKVRDQLLCKYFVCENYENLVEIFSGNLSSFPVTNPLIIKNEIFNALGEIIKNHPEDYRNASIWGESISNKEDYFAKHPEAILTNKSNGDLSYYKAERTPSKKELDDIKSKDGLLNLMLNEGISIPELCSIVTCYEDACAGIELQEEYLLRNIWVGFAAIKNIFEYPLVLESISVDISKKNGFSKFSTKIGSPIKIKTPKMAISTGETVLIPVSIILPPIKSAGIERLSIEYIGEFGDGEMKEITRASIDNLYTDDYLTYGGQINIKSIEFRDNGEIRSQSIHAFDLTNMYLIDKCWQCGSCPHLFFKAENISYEKELLSHCQSIVGEESFTTPNGITSIIIAEIEDEVTYIDNITINGSTYLENITLKKFEYIEISVSSRDVIKIVGKYIPNNPRNQHQISQSIIRNKAVGIFIEEFKNNPNRVAGGLQPPHHSACGSA